MKLWNTYHTPSTIEETLALLTRYAGQARIVAGGTDLLVEIRGGHRPPADVLIDITAVAKLCQIKTDEAYLTVGSGVTHTQIVESPVVQQETTCLAESCGVVGGPQVRNVATLGGNVAHALPAGDGTVSLVALDAEAEIIKDGERRWLPIVDLYRGPGQSLLDPTRDLLLGFRLKRITPGQASAFQRVMRPQGVALPVLGCAVAIELDASREVFTRANICIAPAGPTPRRISALEALLIGQPAGESTIENAVAQVQKTLAFRSSKYRATADYRYEVAAVLLRRTLTLAVERARAGDAVSEGS